MIYWLAVLIVWFSVGIILLQVFPKRIIDWVFSDYNIKPILLKILILMGPIAALVSGITFFIEYLDEKSTED